MKNPTLDPRSDPPAFRPLAEFPHCDELVLHAPGVCVYCDNYPDRQRLRFASGVNFTGQSQPFKTQCPSEVRRTLQTIEKWGGNRPQSPPRHVPVSPLLRRFPWDGPDDPKTVDVPAVNAAIRLLLAAVGEDPDRPGLKDTPSRVARFWKSFIEYDPGTTNTTFQAEVVSDQMVVVSGMRIWSMCEHHLLPFYTDVTCGYIANGRVMGLSKFARIAHKFGHRLQTQEQLATQIADEIARITKSNDVAVLCENGMHTCMTMRGIKTVGSMNNAVMRGLFRDVDNPGARTEFYNLARRQPQ